MFCCCCLLLIAPTPLASRPSRWRGATLNPRAPFFHVALPPLLCYLGGEAEDHFARDRASTEVGVGVVVGVGISNAFGSGLMTIEPGPAAPPAADADCGTLPPKPQPAAAAADPNAMKENEEAGANLLL